jgi:hypothetical protein
MSWILGDTVRVRVGETEMNMGHVTDPALTTKRRLGA